jgi:hypothetical protein
VIDIPRRRISLKALPLVGGHARAISKPLTGSGPKILLSFSVDKGSKYNAIAVD